MKHIPNYIREAYTNYTPGVKKFILAVSGGSDSQCLLKKFPHALRKECECLAVGVNHGFRPEADSELDLAESLATSIGIPFKRIRLRIDVKPGDSLQSVAREKRYEALFGAAKEYGTNYIVTAHHKHDLAETIMIRLLRGSGIDGLKVMPVVKDIGDYKIFRPLLKVDKEMILKELNHFKIKWAEDPSNQKEEYFRVWVRNNLFPMIKEKSPSFEDTLINISNELKEMI